MQTARQSVQIEPVAVADQAAPTSGQCTRRAEGAKTLATTTTMTTYDVDALLVPLQIRQQLKLDVVATIQCTHPSHSISAPLSALRKQAHLRHRIFGYRHAPDLFLRTERHRQIQLKKKAKSSPKIILAILDSMAPLCAVAVSFSREKARSDDAAAAHVDLVVRAATDQPPAAAMKIH
jgi:hypothetical protein